MTNLNLQAWEDLGITSAEATVKLEPAEFRQFSVNVLNFKHFSLSVLIQI